MARVPYSLDEGVRQQMADEIVENVQDNDDSRISAATALIDIVMDAKGIPRVREDGSEIGPDERLRMYVALRAPEYSISRSGYTR